MHKQLKIGCNYHIKPRNGYMVYGIEPSRAEAHSIRAAPQMLYRVSRSDICNNVTHVTVEEPVIAIVLKTMCLVNINGIKFYFIL